MIQSTNILPSFRWKIALLVSAAIAISYLDRQTLPVAIKAVQNDIPISNTNFSQLNTAFLITYGLMYVVGGKLLDLLGTRSKATAAKWNIATFASKKIDFEFKIFLVSLPDRSRTETVGS